MTREEAIAILQEKYDYCKSFYDLAARPKEDYAETAQYLQALQVALTALRPVSRERVEKVWRGEWKPTESPYMNECEDCSVCGYRTPWGHGFRFCPACGAAQTDEAVQMVMERLEALGYGIVWQKRREVR